MSSAVELLFSVTVRVTVLIALAWGAARLLRGRSATIRHLIWSAAAIGALVLLAVAPYAPTVQTTQLPVWQNCSIQVSPVHIELPSCGGEEAAAAASPSTAAARDPGSGQGVGPTGGDRGGASSAAAPGDDGVPAAGPADGARAEAEPAALSALPGSLDPREWNLSDVAFAAWAAGALLVLLTILLERLWVWRLTGSSGAASRAELTAEARELARELGLSSSVDLHLTREDVPPLSWGLWRPRILLPANAVDWPEDHRRSVLLHELGHARRRDVLTQTLAALSCALLWFNPLVWIAAARMREERERACDDLVLQSGVESTSYARCLVDLARRLSPYAGSRIALVGMAPGPGLVERVDRLVSRAAAGEAPGRTTTFVSCLGALAIVGILAPHVVARPDCTSRRPAIPAHFHLVAGPDATSPGDGGLAGFAVGDVPDRAAPARGDRP